MIGTCLRQRDGHYWHGDRRYWEHREQKSPDGSPDKFVARGGCTEFADRRNMMNFRKALCLLLLKQTEKQDTAGVNDAKGFLRRL